MKLKARSPFYHSELGLVKRGDVFDSDEYIEGCEVLPETKTSRKKAGEALPPFPPRRGGKNGNTVKRNPRSSKTGEKN